MLNTQPKILTVYANETDRDVYRDILSPLAAERLEVVNSREALAAAQQQDFALILLVLHRPVTNGYETASMLRLEHRTASTPIVFITDGDLDAASLKHGCRVDAVDYLLSTPVDPEVLRQKVGVFLELDRKHKVQEETITRLKRKNEQLRTHCKVILERQKTIHHQATRDALTNLPNRVLFEDRLDVVIQHACRARQRFALGFMDLDGFKQINDRYGHAAADELLTGVAQRLRGILRQTDTVARIGGDEFALLFENLDGVAAARFLREKVYRTLCAPMILRATFDGTPVEIQPKASIGIVLYPDHASTRRELLKRADASMYAAKRTGSGICVCGEFMSTTPSMAGNSVAPGAGSTVVQFPH